MTAAQETKAKIYQALDYQPPPTAWRKALGRAYPVQTADAAA